MPWSIVAAVACSVVAAHGRAEEARQEMAPPPEPEPTECTSCGAPLSLNAVQCDYCKRLKEPRMFNWFKRTPKETPIQARQRIAAEQLRQRIIAQRAAPRTYSYSSPSPAPAPQSSGPDLTSAYMGYLVGSSSSHSPAPAPEPAAQSFSSGGGGDYGGGGASGSWESSSSCSSSSYSSSDSSSSYSSSSDSGSSSCGGSD